MRLFALRYKYMKTQLVDLNITHLEPYFEMVNSKELHATTNPVEPFESFSREKIQAWLEGLSEKKDRKDFAIIDSQSQDFIGEVVFNEIKNNVANIRVALLPKYFNQGYGTEAIRLAVDYGFKKLNLIKITLGVYSNNPRGIRVYEKCGFQKSSETKINDNLYDIKMFLEKM